MSYSMAIHQLKAAINYLQIRCLSFVPNIHWLFNGYPLHSTTMAKENCMYMYYPSVATSRLAWSYVFQLLGPVSGVEHIIDYPMSIQCIEYLLAIQWLSITQCYYVHEARKINIHRQRLLILVSVHCSHCPIFIYFSKYPLAIHYIELHVHVLWPKRTHFSFAVVVSLVAWSREWCQH